MFIFGGALFLAFVLILLVILVYATLDGDLPTIFKGSKRAYKIEQNYEICISARPYEYKKVKEFPTIALEQFKDFYAINPNSWELRACRVFKDNNERLSFTFTYDEWKKYIQFRRQVDKERAQQKNIKKQQQLTKEQNETTRKILESVQKDINNIYAEHNKNMKETEQLIKGVKS